MRLRPDLRRFAAMVLLASGSVFVISAVSAAEGKLSRADAKKLKSPLLYTKKSIDRGRVLFLQNCTGCHGADGKAETSVIAEATDLTSPDLYKNGTSEGEIFRSIRDGAGNQMPPFLDQVSKEEDIWHMVNLIRSLWPASLRPPLQEDKPK